MCLLTSEFVAIDRHVKSIDSIVDTSVPIDLEI